MPSLWGGTWAAVAGLAPGEQRGSWEQNRKVRVTQGFLARGTAGASPAPHERGGQVGRDTLEESGQRTVGLRSGDKGAWEHPSKVVWGVIEERPGGGQAAK